MLERRLKLHEIFVNTLGSRNVYFQPPESVRMSYPAIVYSLSSIDNTYANNGVYLQRDGYDVTFIHTDPDSEITDRISRLPMCRFVRRFVADNLYHDVFKINY